MVTPDTTTYNAFQKLKEFVFFIDDLPYLTETKKLQLPDIITSIETLVKPSHNCADISLDIF
ncbi:MAG: hypothetical protein ACRDE5_01550, partial [Ginsengibacter sp.]